MIKKVCILTTAHPVFDIRIYYKQARSLIKTGYKLTLIAQHNIDEEKDNIRIIALPQAKNRIKRMLYLPWKAYILALKHNADVYHFHDPELIPVGLMLKLRGKKVIYDVHEDVPRQILNKVWINKNLRTTISRLYEALENWAAKRFNYIIGATPKICERFSKINEKTENINNYPLLNELFDNALQKCKQSEICYIGGISKERGIVELIESLDCVNVKLNLAGGFSSSTLRKELTLKRGWEKVIEYGHVDRMEVKKILERSFAGIVLFHDRPNHVNAQPNKMFEYMSAGIPVISSYFPLWKVIVEKNNCGLCVNPKNSKEISKAINWLLDNPSKAIEMGLNGRKAVEEKYNWEKEEGKLFKIYGELADL